MVEPLKHVRHLLFGPMKLRKTGLAVIFSLTFFVFLLPSPLLAFPQSVEAEGDNSSSYYQGLILPDLLNANDSIASSSDALISTPSRPPEFSGEASWNKTFGNSWDDMARSVIEVSSGGFLVAGQMIPAGGNSDAWLIRTNESGDPLWYGQYGANGIDGIRDIIELSDGGFVGIGYTSSYGSGNYDFWLLRLNSSGEMEWNHTYGGASDDVGSFLIECSNGGFLLSGYTASYGAGNYDMWIIRTDSSGNHVWNSTFGGTGEEMGREVVENSDGGFTIASYTTSYGAGDMDMWLVRIDASGNQIWNQTYGGSDRDIGRGLVKCRDGGYAFVGFTKSYGAGDYDLWLIRTDSNGNHISNQTFGGAGAETWPSIVLVASGGYALAGDTTTWGEGGRDAWLILTDIEGNPQWNQTYGRANDDRVHSLIEYSTGGFVFAGWTNSSGAGNDDFWLVRIAMILDPTWSQTFGGANYEAGNSVVQCRDGGFIITGRTYTYGAGDSDLWLVKTDIEGNIEWTQTFGGATSDSSWSVVECKNGDFAIGGRTTSYGNGWQMWLIRTNETGQEKWNRTYGGISSEHGMSLIECSTGGFALVGSTQSFGAGFGDVWLVRTDENGNPLWNQTFGGADYDSGWSVMECSTGGFAIGGYTDSFGSGLRDAWLIRTDASGNHLWNQTFGRTGYDGCYDLSEVSSGGFVLTGYTNSTGAGSFDAWLIRTDASGDHLWNRTYGGAQIDASMWVIECNYGGFLIGGYTSSFGHGLEDAWLVRINNTGESMWNETYGTTHNERCYEVVECQSGGFAFIGYTNNSVLADYDMWLIRVHPINWVDPPRNQISERGTPFQNKIDVFASYGIGQWWLNDTNNFSINSSTGLITKAKVLSVGKYGIQLWVNDSNGDFLTANFSITIQDTSPPTWDEPPTDQYAEYRQHFSYNLNATDPSGLDGWLLNDTTNFQINSEGIITNNTLLTIGAYGLQIWVNDSYGHTLSTTFNVTVQDTTNPTWNQIPGNKVVEYCTGLSYDINASDASGIASYWINDTTFTISVSGIITNSSALPVDVYWVEVRAYDPYGHYCTATFNITVQDTTNPTWDEPPTYQVIEFCSGLYYDLNASDHSSISYYWVNNSGVFGFDDSILLNITALPVGVYWVEVRAYDPHTHYCTAIFNITVQDTTNPVWLQPPTDQIVEYCSGLLYDVNATDHSSITSYWINDTTTFTISGTGVITNTTSFPVDTYWVEVRAYDPYGHYCTATFNITVQDATNPVWLQPPTDQIVEYCLGLYYDVNASDHSGISNYWVNDSVGFAVDIDGVITNATTFPVGTYWLEIRAYDSYGHYCTATFNITVQDTTNPTWLQTPTNQVVEYCSGLLYDVNATDHSSITSYWINDTTTFTISGTGVITNITTFPVGVYWIEARAYDPYGHYCKATFNITVQDTTNPTWFTTPINQVVELGSHFSYDLDALDHSGITSYWINDTTRFSINAGGTISNATLLEVGEYWVEVQAYDAHSNFCTATFKVTVEDTTSPIWVEAPTDQVLNYGEALSYQLEAWDLSGIALWIIDDTTNFAITSAGLVINLVTLEVGSYSVTVTAFDASDNDCSATFTVFVREVTTTTGPTTTPTTPPPIPGFPFVAIIFGVIVAVGPLIVYRRRKRI